MKRSSQLAGLLALSFLITGIQSSYGADELSKFLQLDSGVVNVEQKEAHLNRRIKEAINAGRLSRQEAQPFLDDLNKIQDLQANFRASSDNLSPWESLKLLFQLDSLSRRFEQSLRDRTSSSADLDTRFKEIESRLGDARSARRLTEQEAHEFTYELNRIKLLMGSYSASSGSLSDNELLQIAVALDTLSGRLESTMHDRQYRLPDIDKLQSEIEKRIAAGIASGKLDDKEAADLKSEFSQIADKEARLRRFGRPLTSVETLELALDIEKLSVAIDKFSSSTTQVSPDYAKRKEAVERRTARGLVSGKLTLAEAYQIKEQLTELEKQQKEWMRSNSDLTAAEQRALMLNLQKIADSVERQLVDTTRSWPGINHRLEVLDNRITTGRSKGRLSESEAASLSDELKRINTQWASYQRTDDEASYSLDPTLAVATAIERLGHRLSDTLHDRSVEVPQLDQLRNNVDDRLASGINDGRLSIAAAKRLVDDLDAVQTKQTGFQTSGSTLGDRERLLIALEYQQLLSRVEKSIRDDSGTGQTLVEISEDLSKQVNEGIVSGKLTDSESTYLKNELARVKALDSSYKSSGSKLTSKEAFSLFQEMQVLRATIDREAKDTEIASSGLGKRMDEIQARINGGVTSGRLTNVEAADLRKELVRIKGLEREYSIDGGMSRGEAVTLAYLLEKLGASVEVSMHDAQTAQPNIGRVEEEIDRKLANAVVAGSMSLTQVKEFTVKLEEVSRLELSFRYSGDGLSYAESTTIKYELEKLSKAIDAALASGTTKWTGLDEGIENTARRILDANEAKKLNADAASHLKAEIDRIQKAKIAFAHSQGGFDLEETETLVHDLDRLNAELDLRLKGQNFAWSDIDRRQQNVELQMKQAIKAGRLTDRDAKQVQAELDRIKRAKAAFTVTDGDLNYFERVSLAEALDRLDDIMKRRTKN